MGQGWSYTAGEYGWTVTVYEREPGAVLYRRWWDPNLRDGAGGWNRRSLGHRSRRKAMRYADEKANELKWEDAEKDTTGPTTLATLFDEYLEHETPTKSKRVQVDDRRRVELFLLRFGGGCRPDEITPDDWRRFSRDRLDGSICAHGLSEPHGEGRAKCPGGQEVRPRVVRADLGWLRTVVRWGTGWKVKRSGRVVPLVASNPLEGKSYPLPPDRNPRQPVLTHTTHLRLMEKASPMLADLLTVANGTGRRLSAVIGLTARDYRSERTSDEPHGAIVWPEDTDKVGKEWRCPVDPEVRGVVERIIQGRGIAGERPLFESPRMKGRPISRDHARKILLAAWDAIEDEKPDGSLWHLYRRKFVTERPHMPDSLVARLAGMSEQTVRIYRQNHPAGLYEALTQPKRLIAVKGEK